MLRLALAALLFASAAHAETANQKAEAEAIGYLRPCHQPTVAREGLCEQNQLNFVEQYILAKSGDLGGMGSTAASFTPPWNADSRLSQTGMPQDREQACAWRLVIAELQQRTLNAAAATDMARTACAPLSESRQDAAADRADYLIRQLRTAPASAPSDDWCAHIPWIKGNCEPPPNFGPLTTTAAPLTAASPPTKAP